MNITTKFNLGDKVTTTELQAQGKVVAVWYGDNGLQYSVRYFDKASPQTVYFYEEELELAQSRPTAAGHFGGILKEGKTCSRCGTTASGCIC